MEDNEDTEDTEEQDEEKMKTCDEVGNVDPTAKPFFSGNVSHFSCRRTSVEFPFNLS